MNIIAKSLYNYILPAILLYTRRVFSWLGRKGKTAEEKVLVIADGHMGDALLNVQSIREIFHYYSNLGKAVSVLCTPLEKKIYQSFPDLNEINFIPESTFFDSVLRPKEHFYRFTKELRSLDRGEIYELIIAVCLRSPWTIYIAAAISAKRKVLLSFQDTASMRVNRILPFFLFRSWFNDITIGTSDIHLMLTLKNFLNHLGIPQGAVQIARFPKMCDFAPPSANYITVAIDATTQVRCLPVRRYAEVIRELSEMYDFDIVLTGSNVTEEIMTEYDLLLSDCPRVINMVRKSSFDEFVELIRGSRLHLCTDSGSIHVAVSVGTRAVCICGVWDKYMFFPYPSELQIPGAVLPVCVYRKDTDLDSLPCANCATRGGYGWGNRECFARCKADKSCLCLEKISINDVLNCVKEVINAEECI